ncbi:MAG: SpoIIE family protein phosphatase [Bacteroidota bacterium]
MPKNYILCVDDDPTVLQSLKQELMSGLDGEFSFELSESGEEGLEIVEELIEDGHSIPVIISDQLMPGMKGDEFLTKVNKKYPAIRKILLTGQASASAVGNAVNSANLYRYISKPWDADDLLQTVKEAAKSYFADFRLEQQVQLLTDINSYAMHLAEHIHLEDWMAALGEQLFNDLKPTGVAICINSNGSADGSSFKQILAGRKNGTVFSLGKKDVERFTQDYPLGVITEAQVNGKTIHLANAVSDRDWRKNPVIEEHQLRSILCAPIMKGDKNLGSIYVDNGKKRNYFEQTKVDLLTAVGKQAGFALDQILLYEDLESKVKSRTSEIQEDYGTMRDSIAYARRLQDSIMPLESQLKKAVNDAFVFNKPKDVLSGDFFWFRRIGDSVMIAVADCTGHGVPGAFMSIMGTHFLNQIIIEDGVTDPGEVLTVLDIRMRNMMQSESDVDQMKDGMDIILINIPEGEGEISYAGARRPLLISEGESLKRLNTTKRSIGEVLTDDDVGFETKNIKRETDTTCYMFSDGVTDQFGDGSKKKFTLKRLQELLTASLFLPMDHQKKVLENRFKLWRGDVPQTDDVIVVGIKC